MLKMALVHTVPVSKLAFAQRSCSSHFTDGRSLTQLFRAVLNNTALALTIEPLRVTVHPDMPGVLLSLDTRRLVCYKLVSQQLQLDFEVGVVYHQYSLLRGFQRRKCLEAIHTRGERIWIRNKGMRIDPFMRITVVNARPIAMSAGPRPSVVGAGPLWTESLKNVFVIQPRGTPLEKYRF